MASKKSTAKAETHNETASNTSTATLDTSAMPNIVAATQAGNFVYMTEAQYKPLLDAGLVEINSSVNNGSGGVAVRASTTGVASVQTAPAAMQPGNGAVVAEAPKSAFAIRKGLPMPAKRRFGQTGGTYPFEQMEVGDSFFVPNTADRPNVSKSLASTISTANKRFKDKAAEEGNGAIARSFYHVPDEDNGVKGASVWRKE